MTDALSIDVVIPSVRVEREQLEPIVRLRTPSDVVVKFFVVVDRPTDDVDPTVLQVLRAEGVAVILNGANLGAHEARNRGFSAGKGDYVLFLDDDTTPDPGLIGVYVREIRAHPDIPGFVGIVTFPFANGSFTKGIVASDILTFFEIARHETSLRWGVSANLLVKRAAAKELCFSNKFPKGGGGEDIDYCLRLVERTGKTLESVPEARVQHPWWGGGRRSYRRFARWAYGDSQLPPDYPELRFYSAPNALETLTIGVPALAILVAAQKLPADLVLGWIGVVLGLELVAETVRLRIRHGRINPVTAVEAATVRLANDLGRVVGNLRRGRLWGLTERFDYFTTGKHISYEKRVALTKFALFVLATVGLLAFIHLVA
jgi:GT2 family glycosyltransferase